MNGIRSKLFISHANPDDNDFSVWLFTRLQLAGYDPWVDREKLLGGEQDFWQIIQETIRCQACKFILVMSKGAFGKPGVIDEWEFAKSIAKEFKLTDFIIYIKIDDVPYNTRIGINKSNVIDFSDSWQQGLSRLIKKLDSDKISKQGVGTSNSFEWILNRYICTDVVKNKAETYYTNWWQITKIPDYFYCHTYSGEKYAEAIAAEKHKYTFVRLGTKIYTFDSEKPVFSTASLSGILPKESKRISTKDLIEHIQMGSYAQLITEINAFRYYLKQLIVDYLLERGLSAYPLSYDECYYYKKGVLRNDTSYRILGDASKWKKMIGSYLNDHYWHFAVSFNIRTFPILCVSIKSHLLFSDNGSDVWADKDRIHSARRRKGKTFFNQEWRDLLMGFINTVLNSNMETEIHVSATDTVNLPAETFTLKSYVGYDEPHSEERLNMSVGETDRDDIEDSSQVG